MGIATRVNGQPPPDIALSDINLGTFEFWELDDEVRDGAFATLRREAPITFFHEVAMEGVPLGPGHWALTKFDDVFFAHLSFASLDQLEQRTPIVLVPPGVRQSTLDDVFFASRHPDIFSSYPNITVADQIPEVAEYFGSMIALDDPRHARLRNIVRSAFTPKVVARTEESVRDRARRLVSDMIANHHDGAETHSARKCR